MNVTDLFTREYEQKDTWSNRKNEPKRTQNEPKFKKAKMNVTSIITLGYENISNWAICENEPKTNPNKANKMPKQTQFKPNTNPIKPNFRGKNMLLRMKINTRRNPLAQYAGEIEASAILHNSLSNICRLTAELIGSTLL
ncbi:MAG: hypothetical protein ACYS91_15560 [Planctomycetota bacterium]